MTLSERIITGGIYFVRSVAGIILRPYEAMRSVAERGSLAEFLFVALALGVYFALASVIKTAAFRPFLLTRQFISLACAAAAGYFLACGIIWSVSRRMGGRGGFRSLAVAWGYSLIPTVCWFLLTSLLYLVLPPPRTTSLAGITFSVLFLVFSVSMLIWKIMLGYLAIRFSLKLDLGRILAITAATVPFLAAYSICMYKVGIFKVPFL